MNCSINKAYFSSAKIQYNELNRSKYIKHLNFYLIQFNLTDLGVTILWNLIINI